MVGSWLKRNKSYRERKCELDGKGLGPLDSALGFWQRIPDKPHRRLWMFQKGLPGCNQSNYDCKAPELQQALIGMRSPALCTRRLGKSQTQKQAGTGPTVKIPCGSEPQWEAASFSFADVWQPQGGILQVQAVGSPGWTSQRHSAHALGFQRRVHSSLSTGP